MAKKKTNTPQQPYHERMAEAVIKALENGTAPWIKPWKPGAVGDRPYNPTTEREYKGWNSVWLEMDKPGEDPRFCTYKQAEAQGWQVRKGAKGTVIQHWKTSDRRLKKDKDGKPVLDEKGQKQYIHYKLDRPKAFTAVVFNAADIDGMPPLPPPKVIPEQERHEKAELMLSASEAPIFYDQGDRAFYRSSTDEIHMPPSGQFNSPDAFYATALHEIGHSTGHESRLDRKLGNAFGSPDYAKEELRAEMASYMLGQELGIGHDPGQHHAYIESWVQALKDDPLEIMRASRDAQSIMEYMMERLQEKELALAAEHPQPAHDLPETASSVRELTDATEAWITFQNLSAVAERQALNAVMTESSRDDFGEKDLIPEEESLVSEAEESPNWQTIPARLKQHENGELSLFQQNMLRYWIAEKKLAEHGVSMQGGGGSTSMINDALSPKTSFNNIGTIETNKLPLSEDYNIQEEVPALKIYLEKIAENTKPISQEEAEILRRDLNEWRDNHDSLDAFRYQKFSERIDVAMDEDVKPETALWARDWLEGIEREQAVKKEQTATAHKTSQQRNQQIKDDIRAGISDNPRMQAFLDTLENPAEEYASHKYMAFISARRAEQPELQAKGLLRDQEKEQAMTDHIRIYADQNLSARAFTETIMASDAETLRHQAQVVNKDTFQKASNQLGWGSDDTSIMLAATARVGSDEQYKTMYDMRSAQRERKSSTRDEISQRNAMRREIGEKLTEQGIDLEESMNSISPTVAAAVERAKTPLKTQAFNDDGTLIEKMQVAGTQYAWKAENNQYESHLNKHDPVLTLGVLDDAHKHFELDEKGMQALGEATITDVRSENLYMQKEGFNYFIKIGRTEDFEPGPYDFTHETYEGEQDENTEVIEILHHEVPQLAGSQPEPAQEKTWLAINFEEHQEAKALAGTLDDGSPAIGWDDAAKSWYAHPGADLSPLKQYLPENVEVRQEPPLNPVQEFMDACKDAGLVMTGDHPIMDGQSHRVPAEGDKSGQLSGEYKGFLDESPAGFIINYRSDYREPWKATGQKLDQATLAKNRAEFQVKAAQRKKEQAAQHENAAKQAQAQWKTTQPLNLDHAYLHKKGLAGKPELIAAFGARQDARNNLVLPIRNRAGEIRCLQHIWGQGNKQFTAGADKQGCFHVIGGRKALKDLGDKEPVMMATGFATAASIHQVTGKPVVVAFNDANLKAVAEGLKQAFPKRTAVVFGDDDYHLTQRPRKPLANGGKEKAEAAAKAVNGLAILPRFKAGPDAERTDFNDLHREEGIEAVKRQVGLGLAKVRAYAASHDNSKKKDRQQLRSKPVVELSH